MRTFGRFTRNVVVISGATAFSQGLVVLVSPILTRLYTPADFGVLAVYTSILFMLIMIASLRYELAIPVPDEEETAANLLILCLLILPLMSLLTALGTWWLADRIVSWTNTPAFRPYLWLLPVGLLGAGLYQVLNYWAIRKQAFGQIAKTKLSQGVGQVVLQVGLGFFKWGPLGLLLGDLAGRIGGSGTLARMVWKEDKHLLQRVSWTGIRRVASRYRKFPLISSGSALLNSAGLQLPALLLAAFYGAQVAGWFAVGQRVLGAPFALVRQAVAQVYLGEAAKLAHQNPPELARQFKKTAQRLFVVGAPPLALIALLGPLLFEIVFGTGWRESGLYLQLLAPMVLMGFVASPLSQTLNLLERQDLQFGWDTARLLLVVGGLWLCSRLGGSARTALLVYSIAMVIAYAALLILSFRVICSKRVLHAPEAHSTTTQERKGMVNDSVLSEL